MEAHITRHLHLTSSQHGWEEEVLAGLFCTCASYGVVESMAIDDTQQSRCATVEIQFQRLSSAERLQTDLQRSGRGQAWQVRCVPPVTIAGGKDILIRSRVPLEVKELRAIAATNAPTVEVELLVDLPLRSEGDVEATDGVWSEVHAAAALVRSRCLGGFTGVMRFPDAPAANVFVTNHQEELARQSIFVQHCGSSQAQLPLALKQLLALSLRSTLRRGMVLRGFVVSVPSNTVCAVDAGVYDDHVWRAGAARQPRVIVTQRNFLKVSVGDEVSIEIASENPATTEPLATLRKVLFSPSAPAHVNPVTGSVGASFSRPTSRAGGTTPGSAAVGLTDVLARLHGQSAIRPATTSAVTSPAIPTAGSAIAKSLASKLFSAIQRGEGHSTSAVAVTVPSRVPSGIPTSQERLCQLPLGVAPFTSVLMRVDRIGEDGLHGRTVQETREGGKTSSAASSMNSLAVYVASSSIPGTMDDWRRFAVVGEVMTVALLYAVAVAGSSATLRCVASKLDADVARCRANPSTSFSPAVSTAMKDLVGTRFTGTRTRMLGTGDLGSPGTSSYTPAFIIHPSVGQLLSATQYLVLQPQAAARPEGSGVSSSGSQLEASSVLVVSEVVQSLSLGHFVVALPEDAYEAQQRQVKAAKLAKELREMAEVKRRLRAALGSDAVSSSSEDDAETSPPTKRGRADNNA